MRVRLGVAMPEKGGRASVFAVEVKEIVVNGRMEYDFTVGKLDRVRPGTVEDTRDLVTRRIAQLKEHAPCAILDVTTPQGAALRQALVQERQAGRYPAHLHRAHAYMGGQIGAKHGLFTGVLKAYAAGRLHLAPSLTERSALNKALVFHGGSGVKKDGVELSSEDESLVVALGLALAWPKHGASARRLESVSVAET